MRKGQIGTARVLPGVDYEDRTRRLWAGDVELRDGEGVEAEEGLAGEESNHFISDLLVDPEKRWWFAVCGRPFGEIAMSHTQEDRTIIGDHVFVDLEP